MPFIPLPACGDHGASRAPVVALVKFSPIYAKNVERFRIEPRRLPNPPAATHPPMPQREQGRRTSTGPARLPSARQPIRIGSFRTGFPVRARIALHTAGAMHGVPGSPMPPWASPLFTMWVSTRGASRIRTMR